MSPIKKTIRDLEKQLKGADPKLADAIGRVILGLKTVIMNQDDPAALKLVHKLLLKDVEALKKARKR